MLRTDRDRGVQLVPAGRVGGRAEDAAAGIDGGRGHGAVGRHHAFVL
jgi:hypothetical protein